MASVNDRLRRLEGEVAPPYEPPRDMDLLLKLVNHCRAILDYRDREGDEVGRLENVPEPGPLVLSLDERREMLASSVSFLDYLDAQRQLNPKAGNGLIDEFERRTRENIGLLETEIAAMEGENK